MRVHREHAHVVPAQEDGAVDGHVRKLAVEKEEAGPPVGPARRRLPLVAPREEELARHLAGLVHAQEHARVLGRELGHGAHALEDEHGRRLLPDRFTHGMNDTCLDVSGLGIDA